VTRLFGCVCNQPKRVSEAIDSVRAALVAPGPVARWGLGYVQASQVLLSRNPRPEPKGVDFARTIDGITSDYIVGWATDEDGLKGTPNTQPFRFRSWLYAQTGTSADGDSRLLTEHMPGYLQRAIRGQTHAEVFFHLFLALLHDSGRLDDPDLEPELIRLALRDSIAFVGRIFGRDVSADFGNVVVCNSRSMVLAHVAGDPLFVRQLKSSDPKEPEIHRFRAVLTVESARKPGDGFEAIPVGSSIVIDRGVNATITALA